MHLAPTYDTDPARYRSAGTFCTKHCGINGIRLKWIDPERVPFRPWAGTRTMNVSWFYFVNFSVK
jgi:hypothetical protein